MVDVVDLALGRDGLLPALGQPTALQVLHGYVRGQLWGRALAQHGHTAIKVCLARVLPRRLLRQVTVNDRKYI